MNKPPKMPHMGGRDLEQQVNRREQQRQAEQGMVAAACRVRCQAEAARLVMMLRQPL